MINDKKQVYSLLLIVIIVILPIFSLNFMITTNFEKLKKNDDLVNNRLKKSQIPDNFTVRTTLHKLIWIEGHLTLYLTAEESGMISCEFEDSKDGILFTTINEVINLTGNSEMQTIQLIFRPLITTLPGNYNFTLNITGYYEYSENFEIILGMGYVIFILIVIIFGTGIIIILAKKGGTKVVDSVIVVPDDSVQPVSGEIPISKISCPECKKLINEGLTFCPECGSRIPEFLRFNPNSPSGT
jgi:hypothetical protein